MKEQPDDEQCKYEDCGQSKVSIKTTITFKSSTEIFMFYIRHSLNVLRLQKGPRHNCGLI